MNTVTGSSQGRWARGRVGAAVAAVGALIFSSGIVMITAPSATADHPGHQTGNGGGNKGGGNKGGGNNGGGNNGGGNNGGGNNGGGNNGGGNNGGGVGGGGGNGGGKVIVCHRRASGSYAPLSVSTNASGGPRGHETHLAGGPASVPGFPDYIKISSGVPGGLSDAAFEQWCRDLNNGGSVPLSILGITDIVSCTGLGSVARPVDTADVVYSISGDQWTGLVGDVVVTATLTDSSKTFTTPLPGDWVATGTTAEWEIEFGGASANCVNRPSLPGTDAATCDQAGSFALPGNDASFSWQIAPAYNGPGTYTVTVTALSGKQFPSGLSQHVYPAFTVDPKKTCGGKGGDDGGAPSLVTPNHPSAGEATCSIDGELIYPDQPAGVLVSLSGTVPGDVTFTFAPARGYAFPAGTSTQVTVRVKARQGGKDCILGEEASRPKPQAKPRDRAPSVLGDAAAIPTAVAAGLGGTPTSAATEESALLAQALMAGGLLLLVSGGSIGLGRRTRGAREA